MKKKLFISAVISFLCSLLFISCQDSRDNSDNTDESLRNPGVTQDTSMIDNRETDDFWDTGKDYTYADRDQFEADFREAREKLDQKIDELQQRADNATAMEREELNNQIDKLKDKQQNLDAKWRDFSNTTEEKWDQFKSDVNSAWDDVETTWEDVDSEFRENL